MANFQLGTKVLILNDPELVKLLYFAKLADGNYNLVESDDDFQIGAGAGQTFTSTFATDTLTAVGHGFVTGDIVTLTTSAADLPAPLAEATRYVVIKVDDDDFQLATEAAPSTAITLTDDGTGTHTVFGTTLGGLAQDPDVQGAEGAGHAPVDDTEGAGADASDLARAGMLRLEGFTDLEPTTSANNKTLSVVGAKGVAGQVQISTWTIVASSVTPGDTLTIAVEIASENFEAEFSSYLSNYKEMKYYNIGLKTGDTATTIATRLVQAIDQDLDEGRDLISATNAAGVVTVTGKSNTISFRVVEITGTDATAGDITLTEVVTQTNYAGRNTYEQLKSLRLETPSTVYPFAQDIVKGQLPIKGAKYSSYLIEKEVTREDLQGSSMANDGDIKGKFRFQIFLNETTCGDYISALTQWLNANVATRKMYASTTAADALTQPEPNVTSAVAVDAIAPFTTPLV